MDDFMILDKEATGETAKLVTHQGSIAVNFAEIVIRWRHQLIQPIFAIIRADFATHPAEIPQKMKALLAK